MFAAIGILLLVGGAILTFAVDRQVEGLDLSVVGWILMAGGGLSLVVALIQGAGWMSASKNKMHVERYASDDGRHEVEESRSA